jgi:hypothetical protein
MIHNIPDWLRYFRITVINQNDILIFDSWEDDINDLKFDHQLGGQKGTKIVIKNKEHIINGIQIYSDKTTNKSSEEMKQYGFQITVVVK